MTTEYQSIDIVKLGPDANAQFVAIADPEVSETVTDGVTVTKSYYRLQNGQPTAFVVPLDHNDSPVAGSYSYKTSGYVGGGVDSFQKVAQPSWNQHYLPGPQSAQRTWTNAVLQPQSAEIIPPYFFPTAVQASQPVQNSVSYPYAAPGSGTWATGTPAPASYDTYSQEVLAAQYKKYISGVGVQHEDLIMAPEHGKGIRVTTSTMSTKSRSSSHAQSVKTATRVPARPAPAKKGGLWCGC